MTITIKSKQYELNTPISAISLLQVVKYLKAISFDGNTVLTQDLDKAASYHFGLLLKNPPLEYFTEQGIRGLTITELIAVFNELGKVQNDVDSPKTATITVDPKDAEIDRLKKLLEVTEVNG
jgi:hypothetical protein